MNYYIDAFRKYAQARGRASRKEFWMFFLFNIIFMFLLALIDGFYGLYPYTLLYYELYYGYLTIFYILIVFIPTICIQIRRLHDIGKSGWWLLKFLAFYFILYLICIIIFSFHAFLYSFPGITIPFIIEYIYIMAKQGDTGWNSYGPPPRQNTATVTYTQNTQSAAAQYKEPERQNFYNKQNTMGEDTRVVAQNEQNNDVQITPINTLNNNNINAAEAPRPQNSNIIPFLTQNTTAQTTFASVQPSIRFCRKCGNCLPEDSQFCQYCGTKIIIAQANDNIIYNNTASSKNEIIQNNCPISPVNTEQADMAAGEVNFSPQDEGINIQDYNDRQTNNSVLAEDNDNNSEITTPFYGNQSKIAANNSADDDEQMSTTEKIFYFGLIVLVINIILWGSLFYKHFNS